MTKVIYVDGQTGQENSCFGAHQVESVKGNLAFCYVLDLRAQANILRAKYGRQLMLHFYLPDGRVFVPFKLRENRIKGDARYGYINLDQVARLLPGEPPTVKLYTGSCLPL